MHHAEDDCYAQSGSYRHTMQQLLFGSIRWKSLSELLLYNALALHERALKQVLCEDDTADAYQVCPDTQLYPGELHRVHILDFFALYVKILTGENTSSTYDTQAAPATT